MAKPAVHVIGRGIVGLSVAWELACRGWQVCVLGPREKPGSATGAAVGVSSVKGQLLGVHPLYQAKLAGHEALGGWLCRLEKATGRSIAKDSSGVLEPFEDLTGFDGIRERVFHRSFTGCHRVVIRGRQELDPMILRHLGPRVKGAFHYFKDLWYDPREALTALESALTGLGATFMEREVHQLRPGSSDGRAGLEAVSSDGIVLISQAVLAAGWFSAAILRASGLGHVALEPSHGSTLVGETWGAPTGLFRFAKTNVVLRERGWLAGSTSYGSMDLPPDPRAALSLPAFLSNSKAAPETLSGTRARCRDRAPAVGPIPFGAGPPRLWVALGFYKNGLQLGPYLAPGLATWMTNGDPSGVPAAFRPERFSRPTP